MNTAYTFETLLFGLLVEVEGKFSPEVQGCCEFEVNTIKHKGEHFQMNLIDDGWISYLEDRAHESASDEAGES